MKLIYRILLRLSLALLAVLTVWTVLGFAGASFIVRRSFRKETIGSLARVQSTIRSQAGL